MTNTRAIIALREIMLTETTDVMPLRRRIEAADQLLGYEAPPEIVEEAKAFLHSVAEDKTALVDFRLDALKLLRKAEARKVTPGRAVERADAVRHREQSRELEISKRLKPANWADDLLGDDYEPPPRRDDDAAPKDLADVVRAARLAHMRKASAKSS